MGPESHLSSAMEEQAAMPQQAAVRQVQDLRQRLEQSELRTQEKFQQLLQGQQQQQCFMQLVTQQGQQLSAVAANVQTLAARFDRLEQRKAARRAAAAAAVGSSSSEASERRTARRTLAEGERRELEQLQERAQAAEAESAALREQLAAAEATAAAAEMEAKRSHEAQLAAERRAVAAEAAALAAEARRAVAEEEAAAARGRLREAEAAAAAAAASHARLLEEQVQRAIAAEARALAAEQAAMQGAAAASAHGLLQGAQQAAAALSTEKSAAEARAASTAQSQNPQDDADPVLNSLHNAITRRDTAAALSLLQRPGPVPGLNSLYNGAPVVLKTMCARLETVAVAILAHPGFSWVNMKDDSGTSLLHLAAQRGRLAICQAILARNDFTEVLAVATNERFPGLASAVARLQGHVEVAEFLEKAEAQARRA